MALPTRIGGHRIVDHSKQTAVLNQMTEEMCAPLVVHILQRSQEYSSETKQEQKKKAKNRARNALLKMVPPRITYS